MLDINNYDCCSFYLKAALIFVSSIKIKSKFSWVSSIVDIVNTIIIISDHGLIISLVINETVQTRVVEAGCVVTEAGAGVGEAGGWLGLDVASVV